MGGGGAEEDPLLGSLWDSVCTSMEAPGASGMVKELVN